MLWFSYVSFRFFSCRPATLFQTSPSTRWSLDRFRFEARVRFNSLNTKSLKIHPRAYWRRPFYSPNWFPLSFRQIMNFFCDRTLNKLLLFIFRSRFNAASGRTARFRKWFWVAGFVPREDLSRLPSPGLLFNFLIEVSRIVRDPLWLRGG